MSWPLHCRIKISEIHKIHHHVAPGDLTNLVHVNAQQSAESTQTQPPGFEQIIATQASQVVARLVAHLRYSSPEAQRIETIIRRARLHILKNATQAIDTHSLARELGISYSALRHNFKRLTGLPPGQYQIQIRLNKARRLLRNSSLSIQEIAARLGFESIYYFSRLFKKKTGLVPLAYRRKVPPPFTSDH